MQNVNCIDMPRGGKQTFAYPKRMKYIARTDSFIEKDCDSLSYVRNVRQPYEKAIARYVNQRVC